jgi:hypothetical protein
MIAAATADRRKRRAVMSRQGGPDQRGAAPHGLVKNGTLKTYKGFPHGMCTTEADTINADLLAFIRS